jgi:hypothetical protein
MTAGFRIALKLAQRSPPDPAISTGFVHQLLFALPNLVSAGQHLNVLPPLPATRDSGPPLESVLIELNRFGIPKRV